MDYRIIIKVVITAVIIVAISEIGKRSSAFGALLAALPLTSLLALTWLYLDTKDRAKVAELSMGVFWAVIPSLVFFVVLAWLMRSSSLSFPLAMLVSIAITVVVYFGYIALIKRFGITL
jgi:hypothetical protein